MGEFRGLGCKVTGDALVEPAMDLCGQIKDFDRHGKVLCKSGAQGRSATAPRDASHWRLNEYISLTDRFQYLSVNIL